MASSTSLFFSSTSIVTGLAAGNKSNNVVCAAGKEQGPKSQPGRGPACQVKELDDKKRLATSYANTVRTYTVTFGACKFPENFIGCQDLAKKKNVPFLSEDLKLECEGNDKFKCGSNVFWKW